MRPPETPASIWTAARARRRAVMPAIQAELVRISALTGYAVEPQSSFFTDTNLPDETSDLDVALVGLSSWDLRSVAERLMQLPLGEDMACRPVTSREGFLITYMSPAGIPVDLQVRRDVEVQFMRQLWAVLRSLPDDVKQEIVWAKWFLRKDKKAYKQYKAGLYAAAGFLDDWHSLTGREPVGSAPDIIACVRQNAVARSQIHIPRVNPKPVEGVPVEVTLREERLGSLTCEIAPGVHMVSQISKTGEHTWVTHGEQRLFFFLRDDQGRGSYFYQSFSGTGGKEQGSWFPSGGLLGSVWVIKGNPKTDPGAGRVSLLEFYEKVNQVLPHSDEDTDALLKKLTGFDYGDFSHKDKFEIKPTFILKEKGAPTELQKKWSGWAYRFWAEHGLTKQWGPRTFNLPDARTNPGIEPGVPDLEGRHTPARYLEGLPRHLQEQRIHELTKSRDEYGKNFKELPTDVLARKMGLVKLSAYREVAQARGFDISQTPDLTDMAAAALAYYRKGRGGSPAEISRLAEGLQQVYRKGLGAWKSGGHRPGASARNWSDARVASLLVGGKAAWTADRKQFALLPDDVQEAVVRALPAVYTALRRQGRQRDIAAIQSASGRG